MTPSNFYTKYLLRFRLKTLFCNRPFSMSKNCRELRSWLNRVHSRSRHCEPVPQHWCGNPFSPHSHHLVMPPAAPFSLLLGQRKWGKRKAAFLLGSFPGNHRTALRTACFFGTWEGFDWCFYPRARAGLVPSGVHCSIGLHPTASG